MKIDRSLISQSVIELVEINKQISLKLFDTLILNHSERLYLMEFLADDALLAVCKRYIDNVTTRLETTYESVIVHKLFPLVCNKLNNLNSIPSEQSEQAAEYLNADNSIEVELPVQITVHGTEELFAIYIMLPGFDATDSSTSGLCKVIHAPNIAVVRHWVKEQNIPINRSNYALDLPVGKIPHDNEIHNPDAVIHSSTDWYLTEGQKIHDWLLESISCMQEKRTKFVRSVLNPAQRLVKQLETTIEKGLEQT